MSKSNGTTTKSNTPTLETRNVFLDTQAYDQYGRDLLHPSFIALAEQVEKKRIALHISDITVMELRRHIQEECIAFENGLKKMRRDQESINRKVVNQTHPIITDVDGHALSQQAQEYFFRNLSEKLDPQFHRTSRVQIDRIFKIYFERRPPFDDTKTKEQFPDAFVVAALSDWCHENCTKMYVITKDQAFKRAANATGRLIPVSDLEEILGLAANHNDVNIAPMARRHLGSPTLKRAIYHGLKKELSNIGVIYIGDLHDGEACGVEISGKPSIRGYTIISSSKTDAMLQVKLRVPLSIEVSYLDTTHAIYDREDGEYIGAEMEYAMIEGEFTVNSYVTINFEENAKPIVSIPSQDIYVKEEYDAFK